MSIIFKGRNGFEATIDNIGMYSDGTPLVKTDIESIAQNADTMILRARSLAEFTVGMFLAESVRNSGGYIRRLILPYLPGARQDRINPTGDVLFSAKSIAGMINAQGFVKVVVLDPHSPTMVGFIKNVREFPLERIGERLYNGYSGIIAPDKGAVQRAEVIAKAMSKPVFFGEKVRNVSTGRLSGFSIDIPAGGHYLVVDDICDGGGTFIGLGEKIREAGAYAHLYVTHGIFSKGTDELKKYYKNIYTTDSFYDGPFGDGIYKVNNILNDMENI